jgi:hypothetical protein
MFRLSSSDLRGRRILIVEDDLHTARVLEAAAIADGGIVIANVPTIEEGLALANDKLLDQAVVHIRYTYRTPLIIPEAFARYGIETVFVACHDDWFDFDDEWEYPPARLAM